MAARKDLTACLKQLTTYLKQLTPVKRGKDNPATDLNQIFQIIRQ